MVKRFTEEDFSNETLSEYSSNYSEDGLLEKVSNNVKDIGKDLIYKAFQLYYVTENPNCPMRVKAVMFGALGYFISPIDFLADFIPAVGYTDDVCAIGAALIVAQMYVDDEVKFKSKKKIADLFGENFTQDLD